MHEQRDRRSNFAICCALSVDRRLASAAQLHIPRTTSIEQTELCSGFAHARAAPAVNVQHSRFELRPMANKALATVPIDFQKREQMQPAPCHAYWHRPGSTALPTADAAGPNAMRSAMDDDIARIRDWRCVPDLAFNTARLDQAKLKAATRLAKTNEHCSGILSC
jgi:hypothetical protein